MVRRINIFITRLGIAFVFALSWVYALNYRGAGDLVAPAVIVTMAIGLVMAVRGARSPH